MNSKSSDDPQNPHPAMTSKPESSDNSPDSAVGVHVKPEQVEDSVESAESNKRIPEGSEQQPNLLVLGLVVEGGMIALALFLGWIGFYDSSQALSNFDSITVIQPALIWSLIGLIPMLVLLLITLKSELWLFRSLRETVEKQLAPLFAKCSIWEILLLSILAGLGEELLFRWSFQGGMTEMFQFPGGVWVALLVAGSIFGLCHFVTPAYAIITTGIGIHLGLIMIWSGTFWAPALAHALYDFVALLVIVKMGRQFDNSATSDNEIAEKTQ